MRSNGDLIEFPDERSVTATEVREVVAAISINLGLGVLYTWSLFILPLERDLGLSRSLISLAASIALAFFTLGMVVNEPVRRALGQRGTLAAFTALAAGGHALYVIWPSYWALVLGYGVLFGTGCGMGYGFALTLAAKVRERLRDIAIGLTVSAFAASGVLLAWLVSGIAAAISPRFSFAAVAGGLVLTGAIAFVLTLKGGSAVEHSKPDAYTQRDRSGVVLLALLFFLMCYPPLMIISHSTLLIGDAGVEPSRVFLGPVLLNVGYIVGAVAGARVVRLLGGWTVLLWVFVAETIAFAILAWSDSEVLVLTCLIVTGLAFGGSASFMPAIVAERFGVEAVGEVYGKLIVGYGLAGLLAPWITAEMFERSNGYQSALYFCIALTICGLLIAMIAARTRAH